MPQFFPDNPAPATRAEPEGVLMYAHSYEAFSHWSEVKTGP